MIASSVRGPRWCLPALLTLAASLTLSQVVGADDFLDQVKRQNQVQAQKLEATVGDLLSQARVVERTDPSRAAGMLRQCRSLLEEDRVLSNARRAELLALVSGRLRTAQDDLRAKDTRPGTGTVAEDPRSKYTNSGTKPPPRAADQARDFIKSGQGQVTTAQRQKLERERAVVGVFSDIDRSNMPVGDETVRFPANWAEKMKQREKFVGPQLTAEEKKLLKIMNSVLSVDFDKLTFRDVIDILQEKTGATILVDKASLEEANVQYDDPVTFSGKKIGVRTILRKILADRGLAYILKDGAIQVVTPQKARETLVTRSYQIADLMPPPQPGVPAFFAQQQATLFAAQLMQVIMNSVEPGSWQINGGPGTISYEPITRAIVVRNSAEMHYSLMTAMFPR